MNNGVDEGTMRYTVQPSIRYRDWLDLVPGIFTHKNFSWPTSNFAA
jgi:hypothetical protein